MNANDRRLGAYQKILKQSDTPPASESEVLIKVPATAKSGPSSGSNGTQKNAGSQQSRSTQQSGGSHTNSGTHTNSGKDSSYRKVAKFLLIIGRDEAAKVMSRLSPEQTERVVLELASIRRVDKDEAAIVLAEFESLLQKAREPSGGIETARSILETAFGVERADEMMKRAVPDLEGKPFDYLADLESERIYRLIAGELPAVKALVLSQMKPQQAANVITLMESTEKAETVLRLAKLKTINPDVLRRVDATIREKVMAIDTPSADSIDGRAALAEILRRMDGSSEKAILEKLADNDPDLGKDLRERLFTIDDIVHADDKFIQEQLRLLADRDLAILVTGKSETFRKKIFINISKTRGALVLEEEKIAAPVMKADSVRITGNFFSVIRRAWERGDFMIEGRNTKEEWVN